MRLIGFFGVFSRKGLIAGCLGLAVLLGGTDIGWAKPKTKPSPVAPAKKKVARSVDLSKVAIKLATEERLGGHTIDRHIAKTVEFLVKRFTEEEKAEASTWDTQRDAESWITKAIKSDAPAIETWLDATSDTKNHVIKSTATANIGFSLTDEAWTQYKASSKGKTSKQQSIKLNKCIDKRKNFTVVLKKTDDDPR